MFAHHRGSARAEISRKTWIDWFWVTRKRKQGIMEDALPGQRLMVVGAK